MVESCCIQQIFIELPEIAGIESSDFLKAEKAVNHKDQPLRIPNRIHQFLFIQRLR